eukprot:UN07912
MLHNYIRTEFNHLENMIDDLEVFIVFHKPIITEGRSKLLVKAVQNFYSKYHRTQSRIYSRVYKSSAEALRVPW